MPRKSKYIQFKDAVLKCFATGHSNPSVFKIFPDIPEGTIKSWRRAWVKEGGEAEAIADVAEGKPTTVEASTQTIDIAAVELEVIDGAKPGARANARDKVARQVLARLPTINDPAFEIAEYVLKELALSGDEKVKVTAARGLLDVVKTRALIPEYILLEQSRSDLDEKRKDYADMEPDELAQMYRELCG